MDGLRRMNLINRLGSRVLCSEETEEPDEESSRCERVSAPELDEAPSKLSKVEQVSRLRLWENLRLTS